MNIYSFQASVKMSTEMLIPSDIVRKRIHNTIKSFYEVLHSYCVTMNWKFDRPTPAVENPSIDKIFWSNNMVTFEERNQYENGSPREFHISYTLPSFIAEPTKTTATFENIRLPEIGYYHTFSVEIPLQYPLGLSRTKIFPFTHIWHINFKLTPNTTTQSKLPIAGELEGIAMNLFHQLLWNPEIIYSNENTKGFAVNELALHFTNTHGRDFPFKVLKNLMLKKFNLYENETSI